mmetsp:Transcript_609/g.1190  ORF Transcript_609/g.1190 Transcript_609/m.1190 type:complete len:228 (+) Transcript_609:738-1421(+)
MARDLLLADRPHHLVVVGHAHVHEHIGARPRLGNTPARALNVGLAREHGAAEAVGERVVTSGLGHVFVIEPEVRLVLLELGDVARRDRLVTRPDVDEVVAAVHVAAVHEHRVKAVGVGHPAAGVVVWAIVSHEAVEVKSLRELKLVVDLDHVEGLHVKLEPLELNVEHGRKPKELDALLRILLAVALRLVLVVAIEVLRLDVLGKRVHDRFAPLDVELNVVVRLLSL